MAGNDDVTVLIPCFNHGRFLGEAVLSALRQEGGPPRVLVVDDGSNDEETAAAIEALPEEVGSLWQANAGHSAARNAGAERVTTPLLLMLDADDRLPADAIATMREPLDADPGLGYAYGIMRFFGAWTKEIRLPPFDPYRLLYRPIVGWLGMIRTEVFRRTGGFDPGFPGHEDWDWTLTALEKGIRGRQVPKVVLNYRKHERSMVEEHRREWQQIYGRLREKHATLFERADEFARESDLGPAGRLFYRTYWARRPLPARFERQLYGLMFR